MIAIPVLRSRVAPVLDWCTRVVLIDPEQPVAAERESADWDASDPFQQLRAIHRRGVTTVICGTLSRGLLLFAESLGMEVISGISGELPEVLEGYRAGRLHEASFRLPGCRGRVQHRMGGRHRRERRSLSAADEAGSERVRSRGQSDGAQPPGAGHWVCPGCGAVVRHQPGTPCRLTACPNCGAAMVP